MAVELQFGKMENDRKMESRDDYIVESREWEDTGCIHSLPTDNLDGVHLITSLPPKNDICKHRQRVVHHNLSSQASKKHLHFSSRTDFIKTNTLLNVSLSVNLRIEN